MSNIHKNAQKRQTSTITFKKGISLEEYMKQSNDLLENGDRKDSLEEEDLYAGSIPREENAYLKMATFAINEIDQQNYQDDSSQFETEPQDTKPFLDDIATPKPPNQLVSIRLHHLQDTIFNKKNQSHSIQEKALAGQATTDSKSFRIKNQSISPKKMSPLSNKDMIRSLYGNSFASPFVHPSEPSILSSTIHNRFFKPIPQKQTIKKEVEFRQKNKRHYNEVMKYENIVRNKYYSKFDILNIRVDGVRDRLCERKPFQKV